MVILHSRHDHGAALLSIIIIYYYYYAAMLIMIIYLTTSNVESSRLLWGDLSGARTIDLGGAVGPESLAFDPKGRGPYTGVADGRILKWHAGAWHDFAVTSSQRNNGCSMASNPEMEHICGRPLGLMFHNKTGNLYVADAYLGLQVIGPNGGLGKKLVTKVQGKPLLLTNDLDIDQERGLIYFTDSSNVYQRKDFTKAFLAKDKTGMLIKYDIARRKVTVLLRGIAFANGLCLSEDRSYVLVAESTAYRVIRFWLNDPKRGSHEVFARVPGTPDNIRRSTSHYGTFWVALSFSFHHHQSQLSTRGTVIKLSRQGRIVQMLQDVAGHKFNLVSQVQEKNGKLWIASLQTSYVGIFTLKKNQNNYFN